MPQKEKVFVSGHRNPDTDSICSAIAYAYLTNKKGKYEAIPVRLGPVNLESEYALNTFGVEAPRLLKTVKQTVEDLNYDRNTMLSKHCTLQEAWENMKKSSIEAAPVIEDDSTLLGLLTKSKIISGYMGDWDSEILAKSHTKLYNIVDTLKCDVLCLGDKDEFTGKIHIAAMRPESAKEVIKEGDIVITGGDREQSIKMLIETKVGLIILTGNQRLDEETIKKCAEANISVLSTPYFTYEASQRIVQAVPITYVMQDGAIKSFNIFDTLDDVKEVMAESRYRCYPVIDDQNQVVGSVSRYQVLQGEKKKVILVDHNERSQSIVGIEQAEVLEVIDHHRTANFETQLPLLYRAEPVGCTATIITKLFDEEEIEIPKHIAGLMLSAIISDTLLFKSPTCTKQDISAAKRLAKIAEVDIESYGMEMFKAGTSLKGKSVAEIFNADYKTFNYGPYTVGVGQVNSLDIEGFLPIKAEMLEYMNNTVTTAGLDFALLLVTDIINSNSEIFAAGNIDKVEKAFDVKLTDNQGTLYGVVSRKKQVVPAISSIY